MVDVFLPAVPFLIALAIAVVVAVLTLMTTINPSSSFVWIGWFMMAFISYGIHLNGWSYETKKTIVAGIVSGIALGIAARLLTRSTKPKT